MGFISPLFLNFFCKLSDPLYSELNLQIANVPNGMCLDAKEKSEEETPVSIYECHGQGGNQVSTSMSTSSELRKGGGGDSESLITDFSISLLYEIIFQSLFCCGCILS